MNWPTNQSQAIARRISFAWAHTGTWLEIPATNKRVTVRMMSVHRIERGKIAEDWALVESLGFFQQLGLIPPTPELFSRAKER